MRDKLGRNLASLRISVTDRCNLRCRYCMPREVYGPGFQFLGRAELLSFEEIARLARVFAQVGVSKIRLTGGEPLLRRDLERLIGMLASVKEISEIALTTNGLLLAAKARSLADAGLQRVTVSLDALDDSVLEAIGDAPSSARRVLAGIDAAIDAGLEPVKVNMVVRREINDRCVSDMAAHFRHRPVVLRFIEYMDVGSSNRWRREQVVSAADILKQLDARWPLQPLAAQSDGEVASRYRYRDGAGEIGLIHSVSEPFCASCDRARLSADGMLFTCLFARVGTDLRELLRAGTTDAELLATLKRVWARRSDRYSAERASASAQAGGGPKVEMSYIGG